MTGNKKGTGAISLRLKCVDLVVLLLATSGWCGWPEPSSLAGLLRLFVLAVDSVLDNGGDDRFEFDVGKWSMDRRSYN